MRGQRRIFPGMTFGRWTVHGEPFNTGSTTYYRVTCACGSRQEVPSPNLLSGASSQCSACAHEASRVPRVHNLCPDCGRRNGVRRQTESPKVCKGCHRRRLSAAVKHRPRKHPVSIGLIAYEARCTRQNVQQCIEKHGWDGMVRMAKEKWGIDVPALAHRKKEGGK